MTVPIRYPMFMMGIDASEDLEHAERKAIDWYGSNDLRLDLEMSIEDSLRDAGIRFRRVHLHSLCFYLSHVVVSPKSKEIEFNMRVIVRYVPWRSPYGK